MSTNVSSSADFQLANMADDLLSLTLDLCGRKDDKTPRFPRLLYDGYVSQIIAAAVAIQKNIIMANDMRRSEARTKLLPAQAAQSYAGWRTHALEGNCRNLVLKMDGRFDNRLRDAGYELKIKERNVEICPVQSRN